MTISGSKFPPLQRCAHNRRWLRIEDPFPHVYAQNVFESELYLAFEASFQAVLSLGLSDKWAKGRFCKSQRGYDAYQAALSPEFAGALGLFLTREWHDLLARLFSVKATGDVDAGLHHHLPGSASGKIHNDLSLAWFTKKTNPQEVELFGSRCDFYTGKPFAPCTETQETVRAVAMLFYLNNQPWKTGDGGETAIYRSAKQPLDRPTKLVPPINNSILAFECAPYSYHTFLSNRVNCRNCLVMWVHRPKSEVIARWGEDKIVGWSK